MRFGISVIVSLCVVVYAPTGPGASFSETPFSRPRRIEPRDLFTRLEPKTSIREIDENMKIISNIITNINTIFTHPIIAHLTK